MTKRGAAPPPPIVGSGSSLLRGPASFGAWDAVKRCGLPRAPSSRRAEIGIARTAVIRGVGRVALDDVLLVLVRPVDRDEVWDVSPRLAFIPLELLV